MRKRKNSSLDGVIFVSVLIVIFIILIVRVVLTILTITFPFIFVLSWISFSKIKDQPPEIENPSGFNDKKSERAISSCLSQIFSWRDFLEKCYALGESRKVYRTKASDQTRFDERLDLGRHLNQKIEHALSNIDKLYVEIRSIQDRVRKSFPEWNADSDKWVTEVSKKRAFKDALLGLCISITVCYLWALIYSDQAFILQNSLSYNLLPNILFFPMTIAILVAYLCFWLRLMPRRQEALGQIDQSKVAEWHSLLDKWNPLNDPDTMFEYQRNSYKKEKDRRDPSKDEGKSPWWEVLGVNREANIEDIRTAYHTAIKAYHSDRVAGMGQKLQQLAKEESQAINAAYEEAKKSKQNPI